MERNKTMLIIGAGAHYPYLYPLSEDISKKIALLYSEIIELKKNPEINKLAEGEILQLYYPKNPKKEMIEILEICRLMPLAEVYDMAPSRLFSTLDIPRENYYMYVHVNFVNYLEKFLENFLKSRSKSIDDYLILSEEGGGEYELGKLLIAYFLFQSETRPLGYERDWIELYIDRFIVGEDNIEHIRAGNIHKIYTFNYDLNFERNIFNAIQMRMNLSGDEAAKIVKLLKIHHIYGGFQTGVFNSFDYFRPNEEKEEIIVKATQNISLIRSNNWIWKDRENFLADFRISENIFFLGFGFDPINSKNIFKDIRSETNKNCISTNLLSRTHANHTVDFYRQFGLSINFFEDTLGKIDCKKMIEDYLF